MAQKKLIELYYEWEQKKKLPDCGLCYSLPRRYKKYLELFHPTNLEEYSIRYWCWASDENNHSGESDFGPTRQNIVLFICAMAGEV